MEYNEYMQLVIDSEQGSLTDYPRALHAIMGMNGEAGECVDLLKKTMFQGHEFDENHFLNELGDVCWYTTLLIIEMNIDPGYIFGFNGRLLRIPRAKDGIVDYGLSYILDLNSNCGRIVDLYYDSHKGVTVTVYSTLRSIFDNITKAANIYGKTLDEIFELNYNKIKLRYPEGFNTKMSVNRSDIF